MKLAVPLSKNILAPLGITAAASAIDAGIQEFLEMLLGTLGATLLRNMLAGKVIVRAGYGHGKGIVKAGYGFLKKSNSTSSFNKL